MTSDLIGIGTDLVDLDRFRAVLARTPRIVPRLFTDGEQAYACARRDPTERLGARFAAKEAAMKALRVGVGEVDFRDLEVVRLESGAPVLAVRGRAAAVAERQGVGRWLITLSHTAHLAQAVVVALGRPGAGDSDGDDRLGRELTDPVIRRPLDGPRAVPPPGSGRSGP